MIPILKLSQRIVPKLNEEEEACITVDHALKNLAYYVREGDFAETWALNLCGTGMRSTEFQLFWKTMSPSLSNLRVLILGTVDLSMEECSVILESFLPKMNVTHIDLCCTLHSNRDVIPVLMRGEKIHKEKWIGLSRKLIFSGLTYYFRLPAYKWVKDEISAGRLADDWVAVHANYYSEILPIIEKAPYLRFVSGFTDDDRNE